VGVTAVVEDHRAMVMTAAIISIGDELLCGDIVDTNLAEIARALRQRGVVVQRAFSVPDQVDAISGALRAALAAADRCIVTGGLGPTSDDLTAAAVAAACDLPLVRHPDAEAQVIAYFAARGRGVDETQLRQANLPQGAAVLANPIGSAPGFACALGRGEVICLPGVPREMRALLAERVLPRLAQAGRLRPSARRIYRTLGLGEADLAAHIEPIAAAARDTPALRQLVVHYRVAAPEVFVTLEAGHNADNDADAALRQLDAPMRARLGGVLYGIGEAELNLRIGRALAEHGLRLAAAESCTGGRVAAQITAVAGSSAYFHGGVVAYDNAIKTALLGVPEATLAAHGAVSEATARSMAEGLLRSFAGHAELAVAITGIAGPGGGSLDKPVGTVDFAVADDAGTLHRRLHLRGDRQTIQHIAAMWALRLVWDRLVERGLAQVQELDSAS